MAVTISTIEGDDIVNASEASSATFSGGYSPWSSTPVVTYQILNSSSVVVRSGGASEDWFWQEWSVNVDLSTLPDGNYTFSANYDDDTVGAGSRGFTLDRSAPTITSGGSVSVPENTSTSTTVYTATANETVTWSLHGTDANDFSINSSGQIKFDDSPNYENPDDSNDDNVYSLTVRATDTAGNITNKSVTITVTDVDEVPPTVTSGSSVSVPENTATTTTVYQATANETVTWAIVGGNDAGDFTVTSGGALKFAATPDFEAPADSNTDNSYQVVLQAKDAAGNTTNKNVTVNVTNVVEDVPPTVSTVTYGSNDGTLRAGESVTLSVKFSENVTVSGSPTLSLNTGGGGVATYIGGSGTDTLTFTYTAAAGQNTSDLEVTALNLNGGSIKDSGNNNAVLSGAATDPAGTLVVDTTAPPAPSTPNLAAADDTGPSDTDNYTKQTSGLTITGSGDTNAVVTLFSDVNNNGVQDIGETVLASTAVSSGSWTDNIALAEGVHNVRAFQTDQAGNKSAISSALTITVDTTAPAAPSIDLDAADDTGNSNSDNITNRTSGLTITGTGEDGTKVTIYRDGNKSAVEGAATVSGGVYSIDISQSSSTTLRAFLTDKAGNESAASSPLNLVIDTNAPNISGDTTNTVNENFVGTVEDFDANESVTWSLGGVDKAHFTIGSDGKLSFISPPDYENPLDGDLTGIGWFTRNNIYTLDVIATDKAGNSDSRLVFVTVDDVNENKAPTAENVSASGAEDGGRIAIVLKGDDPDAGDQVTTFNLTSLPSNGKLYTASSGGTLLANGATINASGEQATVYFEPDANYNGGVSFTYRANDGEENSDAATASITVTAVNDAPTGVADPGYALSEDTILNGASVLANDTDVENDALTAEIGSQPTNGVVSLNADGTFTYTPNANFHGVDTFTYYAKDSSGAKSAETTVKLTVEAVNDAPTGANDSYTVSEDSALTVVAPGVLGNDKDVDSSITAALTTGVSNGALTLNPDGSFVYTPKANFNGTDSFTYVATDGLLNSETVTVTIEVTSLNDSPTATNFAVTTAEDTPTGPVKFNASDVDGDTLTYIYNGESAPKLGALTIDQAGGTFTFTPNANANGVETLKFLISDGKGGLVEQSVLLTVTPVNDAPTAPESKTIEVTEDVATAPISVGAADVDGDTLDYKLAETGPAKGTVTFDKAAGTYVYTPFANANGADSFKILVSDSAGGMVSQTVTVNIAPVNDNPDAVNDTLATRAEDAGLLVVTPASLLANDSILPDVGETLTITAVGAGVGGTVSLVGGAINFNQATDFNGVASFQYTVSDGNGGTDTATVSFNVTPSDDAPAFSADNQKVVTPENQTAVGTFAAIDPDGPGGLTYALSGKDAGLFNLDAATGALSFKVAPDFETMPVNPVYVSITATDSTGLSDLLNLTVEVGDVAEAQPEGPPPIPPPPNPNPGGEEPEPQVLLEDAFRNIMRYPVNDEYRPRLDELVGKVEDGEYTLEKAIGVIIDWADGTTAVATMTYQFFTGKVPTFGGLDWLVAPDGPNPNSLNEDYYAKFSFDSRFINFAVNLGTNGVPGQAFALEYGNLTLAQATKAIYEEIFGFAADDQKVVDILSGLVPNGLGGTMTRQAYLTSLGGSDIGAKAAMAGWLLSYAALTDEGVYGGVNEAFLLDIADGGTYDISMVGVYQGGLGG